MGSLRAVAPLHPTDTGAAVAVLARAFQDNPINVAVIRRSPARRRRCNAHGMRATLRAAGMARAPVLAARPEPGGPLAGVLLAVPPGGFPLPRLPLSLQLRCIAGQGLRVVHRWSLVQQSLEGHHPIEPHWYLGVVGVDPGHQGRGLGKALVEYWLDAISGEPAPVYLETDREENLGFYRGMGFETTRELTIFGARVWCMQRSWDSA